MKQGTDTVGGWVCSKLMQPIKVFTPHTLQQNGTNKSRHHRKGAQANSPDIFLEGPMFGSPRVTSFKLRCHVRNHWKGGKKIILTSLVTWPPRGSIHMYPLFARNPGQWNKLMDGPMIWLQKYSTTCAKTWQCKIPHVQETPFLEYGGCSRDRHVYFLCFGEHYTSYLKGLSGNLT